MAVAAAIGTAALTTSGIWSYNRENFMYDREMRQKQEFTVLAMRLKQADLWREDVRDLIGLTEARMDTYLLLNALELGMCLTLFTEGRLEPGTPQWLLWLYMLSLMGAFMFLLLSTWFALHASVTAQGNCVRLLTQMVRPAVPSWGQVESMRTYGYAFEGQRPTQMLRVPVLQTITEGSQAGAGGHSGCTEAPPGSAAADPWGLERRGDDIYELQRRPIPTGRHVRLVRESMRRSQAYDAWARVSMTLGTISLCHAISYFMLGYALVQDGSPWAAWACILVLQSITSMLLQLDLSVSLSEHRLAQFFLIMGPVLAAIAGAEWSTYREWMQVAALTMLPGTYLMHAAFLLMFLKVVHVKKQIGDVMIPTSFRAILYLDVFGWLLRSKSSKSRAKFTSQGGYASLGGDIFDSRTDRDDSSVTSSTTTSTPVHTNGEDPGISACGSLSRKRLKVVHGQNFPRHFHRKPVALRPEDVDKANLSQNDPDGGLLAVNEATEHLLADLADFEDARMELTGVGPVGVIPTASERTFAPESFAPEVADGSVPEGELKSDREVYPAGQLPWLVFRGAVVVLTCVWLAGGAWVAGQAHGLPDFPDRVLPESVEITGNTAENKESSGMDGWALMSPHKDALPSFLPHGERILTQWPTTGFQPWDISCDSTGRFFVVSDEFQLYFATMQEVLGEAASKPGKSLQLGNFQKAPHCDALEGQVMRDVGLVCGPQLGPGPSCKALVLHERGTRLAECPLNIPESPAPQGSTDGSEFKTVRRLQDAGQASEDRVWSIPNDWLRSTSAGSLHEEVVSVAIDNVCNQSKGWSADHHSGAPVPQNHQSWCPIVGTTRGRMIRLRPSLQEDLKLVPAAVIWNVHGAEARANPHRIVATSLLHTLPGGYLLKLRDERRSVHAIDILSGKLLGEWRLPELKGLTWSALAGGDAHLFLTSQSASGDHAELWRFPLPRELRA